MSQPLDGIGIAGTIMHAAFVFALVGTSLLFLIYCWQKKILSFDQKTADEMMDNDDFDEEKEGEEEKKDE